MAENLPQVEYMVAMGIRNGWVDPHRGWGGVMWCRKKIMQSMMLSSGAAVFLEGSSLGLRKIARKAQDIRAVHTAVRTSRHHSGVDGCRDRALCPACSAAMLLLLLLPPARRIPKPGVGDCKLTGLARFRLGQALGCAVSRLCKVSRPSTLTKHALIQCTRATALAFSHRPSARAGTQVQHAD